MSKTPIVDEIIEMFKKYDIPHDRIKKGIPPKKKSMRDKK